MHNKNSALKNIGKNILSLLTSEFIGRLLGAVVLLILPRYLGPSDYGVYSLAISYFTIFSTFTTYGLDALFIKDVARDKSLSVPYFCTHIMIKGAMTIVSFALLSGILVAMNYPARIVTAILSASSAIFFFAIVKTYTAVFRAYEQMEYNAILEVSRSVVALMAILLVINLGGTVITMLLIPLATYFALSAIGFILISRKFFTVRFKIDRSLARKTFILSTPFFLASVVAVIQNKIDIVMISKLATTIEVGLFSAASELINILFIVPNLISTVLFPVFSKQFHKSSEALITAGNLSTKYLIIIGLPISAGFFFTAPMVVPLIYGNKFSGAIEILQILSAGVGLLFASTIIGYVLLAAEQVNQIIIANIISVVLNIILNSIFIPNWGAKGAGFASIICTLIRTSHIFFIYYRSFGNTEILRNFVKPLLATAFMSAMVLYFDNLILIILVGTISYIAAILALKTLKKDELVMIRQMIPFGHRKVSI